MRHKAFIFAVAALLAVVLSGFAVSSGAQPASIATLATETRSAAPLAINVDGIGYGFECELDEDYPACVDTGAETGEFRPDALPADPDGDIGPNHYVQTVNFSYAVFDRNGATLQAARPTRSLFAGVQHCDFYALWDGIVRYDGFADRWIISAQAPTATEPYQCIAVSKGPNPAGEDAYYRYVFGPFPEGPDYAKMALWPSAGLFDKGSYIFSYWKPSHRICAYNRAALLRGDPQSDDLQQCTDIPGYEVQTNILPSDLDGPTLAPQGSPSYLIAQGPEEGTDKWVDTLAFWRLDVDWTAGGKDIKAIRADADIEVTPFIRLLGARQPSGSSFLTNGRFLMNRFAYRNYGDHESLVVSHAIDLDPDPAAEHSHGAVRWYEFRCSINTGVSSCETALPEKHREITHAPDSHSRSYSSAAMDAAGNVGVGYNISSTVIPIGIRYTGFQNGIPIAPEVVITDGGGSSLGGRWGDYASTNIDPSDDCTFWHTNMYMPKDEEQPNPPWEWRTRIASFRLEPPGSQFCLPTWVG